MYKEKKETMRFLWIVVTVVACLCHNFGCTRAAPARTTDEILLGQVDIDVRDDDDSNEVTMKPSEKKCIVDGKSYSHAQAVSYDANSRCICVAGNVYCFWHGLPPATAESLLDGARNNNRANKDEWNWNRSTEPTYQDSLSSSNDTSYEDSPLPSEPTNEDDLTDMYNNIEGEKSDEDVDEAGDNDDDSIDENDDRDQSSEESTGESLVTSSKTILPTTPITCFVLDRTYRVGEVLPHNTGNCIECSCGPEGHVVCAPRDCVSIVPHRDYREENFQIPIAGDLRGIDENF